MTAPITRSEARRLGLTSYFTGKPCPYGHVAPRQVGNGDCNACKVRREQDRLRRKLANREKDAPYRIGEGNGREQ